MFMNEVPILPAQAETPRVGAPEAPPARRAIHSARPASRRAGPGFQMMLLPTIAVPAESFGDFPGNASRVIAIRAKSLYFCVEQIENIYSVGDFNQIKINNLPF